MEIVPGTCGYERDYWLENVKLIDGISCVLASGSILSYAISRQQNNSGCCACL